MQLPWAPQNIGPHASATHEEVVASGPPTDPESFPTPDLGLAQRDVSILLVSDGSEAQGLETAYLGCVEGEGGELVVRHAYWCLKDLRGDGKSLARNGKLRLCQILDPISQLNGSGEKLFHISKCGLVVVKEVDKRIAGAEEAGRREAAAMQYVRPNGNRHVLSSSAALEDERYLYIVMPYCEGGDLFSCIWYPQLKEHRLKTCTEREAVMRHYFRQLLLCLHYLQSIRVCHADLSPENIMMREGQCVLIDLDTCLLVRGQVGDRVRRLITPRILSAKEPYMAPEIFLSRLGHHCKQRGVQIPEPPAFDGYAADLWTLGTTLYVMLTADFKKLYDVPFHYLDMRYRSLIYNGNLAEVLRQGEATGVQLSEEAIDLLDKMLKHNPSDRLTLEQVMLHPWVCNPEVIIPEKDGR